ncbi:MAG TPA: hypothetical protein VJ866_23760 [Pyrinomonadaceae bacterium]|nr:hypothetical protein [Pyrinomonadaceae bacterium]
MSTGEYYNRPAADWARHNITGRVEVKLLFSSTAGRIFIYALLFCVPGFFLVLGLVLLALGAKAKDGVGAAFFFGFLISIPCVVIVLLGAYVRRGLAKSLDAEGVSGSFGQRFLWGKLYYVDHVSKYTRAGRVTRKVKDNQLELVFEGGKLIIAPMIHGRAEIWQLINAMPVEVRDDGVPRAAQSSPEQQLMAFLNSLDAPRRQGE